MSSLIKSAAWNLARALKLHEHFQAIAMALPGGAKVGAEHKRVQRILDGLMLPGADGQWRLELSVKTIEREWGFWLNGGRKGSECPEHVRRPESLLCCYKAGCGGSREMPKELARELQRRMLHATGGRDKHSKAPISAAWNEIRADFKARRPLPGVDYSEFPEGAECPWSYSTACRKKPNKGLRKLGNVGASAHKGASAYVSLNYSKLRKGELYTLDDVRLDIVCFDELGNATEVVLYIFMEVGSRCIVGYVMKPARAIKQEDVDELLSHMLQVPGYGIGIDYITHVLFERGTTACSVAAQMVLEGVTNGRIKVHRTGMVGGVRWLGTARDKAKGNSAGKAVIESFNRSLHFALLHLPGQRGMSWDVAPQNLGALGGANFVAKPKTGKARKSAGTFIDAGEELAQFEAAFTGQRMTLRLPGLRIMQVNAAVADAIRAHNAAPGHEYRGHGSHWEEEVDPGVWRDTGMPVTTADTSFPAEEEFHTEEAEVPAAGKPPLPVREYKLKGGTAPKLRNSVYFGLWKQIEKLKPGLDRFALTRRTLGHVTEIALMTDADFENICTVFRAIVRDATA